MVFNFLETLLLLASLSAQTYDVTSVLNSVGMIRASNQLEQSNLISEGSAVIIDAKGIVVTSSHVLVEQGKLFDDFSIQFIENNNPNLPVSDSRKFPLEIVNFDEKFDLAILKIKDEGIVYPNRFKAIKLGSSEHVQITDEVYVIGFPAAGGETVTVLTGKVVGKDDVNRWIKVDTNLMRGISGGAVINSRGQLIGIATLVRADIVSVNNKAKENVSLGVLGFVRPVELVIEMMGKMEDPTPHPRASRVAIRGKIEDDFDQPVVEALVGILKGRTTGAQMDNLIAWTRSNNNGVFELDSLSPGGYTLVVRKPGYRLSKQYLFVEKDAETVIKLESTQAFPKEEAP